MKEKNESIIKSAWSLHDEINREFEEDDGADGLIESCACMAIDIGKAFGEYEEKIRQLKVFEVRYLALQERYLENTEKHFGELCGLYFEDESYPAMKEKKQ